MVEQYRQEEMKSRAKRAALRRQRRLARLEENKEVSRSSIRMLLTDGTIH